MLEPVHRYPALHQKAIDLCDGIVLGILREGDSETVHHNLNVRTERRPVEQAACPLGVGALDLHLEGGPCKQLGDRPLPNHRAAINNGHRVACALDLVEKM